MLNMATYDFFTKFNMPRRVKKDFSTYSDQ